MTAHTPGPWQLIDLKNGRHSVDTLDMCPVCILSDVCPADARLIAAAPELLEALEELVSRRESACAERGEMDRLGGSDGRYNRARAAIAKAKGDAQ